jgi:hypothetical protein
MPPLTRACVLVSRQSTEGTSTELQRDISDVLLQSRIAQQAVEDCFAVARLRDGAAFSGASLRRVIAHVSLVLPPRPLHPSHRAVRVDRATACVHGGAPGDGAKTCMCSPWLSVSLSVTRCSLRRHRARC